MFVLLKVIQVVVLIALMTGSVYAQVVALPDNRAPLTNEEKDKNAAEAAYRSSLKVIPGTERPVDPWGNVRRNIPPAAKNKQQ
jgi:hypothetical protein